MSSEQKKKYDWRDPMGLEKVDIDKLTERQRRQRIMQLLIAGWSYEMIGHALDLSAKQVSKLVQREIVRTNKLALKATQEYRDLEVARCEEMLRLIWPKVQDGNPRAIEVAIKISERIARLRGLDKETQVHHQVNVRISSMSPPELEEEAKRLGLPMPPALQIPEKLPGEEVIEDAEILASTPLPLLEMPNHSPGDPES